MYICGMNAVSQILDNAAMSDGQVAAQLGIRFKEYRKAIGMTQKQLSSQSGVSIMTIVRFEKGNGGAIRLDNLIALMRAVQRLDDVIDMIPEMPESLYLKDLGR